MADQSTSQSTDYVDQMIISGVECTCPGFFPFAKRRMLCRDLLRPANAAPLGLTWESGCWRQLRRMAAGHNARLRKVWLGVLDNAPGQDAISRLFLARLIHVCFIVSTTIECLFPSCQILTSPLSIGQAYMHARVDTRAIGQGQQSMTSPRYPARPEAIPKLSHQYQLACPRNGAITPSDGSKEPHRSAVLWSDQTMGLGGYAGGLESACWLVLSRL